MFIDEMERIGYGLEYYNIIWIYIIWKRAEWEINKHQIEKIYKNLRKGIIIYSDNRLYSQEQHLIKKLSQREVKLSQIITNHYKSYGQSVLRNANKSNLLLKDHWWKSFTKKRTLIKPKRRIRTLIVPNNKRRKIKRRLKIKRKRKINKNKRINNPNKLNKLKRRRKKKIMKYV